MSRGSEDPVFEKARQFPPGPEREACLDHSCGDDAELRLAVTRRLKEMDLAMAATVAAEPLERCKDDAKTIEVVMPSNRIAEGPGSVLGPYKLLQEIGEGGFGLVYVADQQEPVKRRVALKIIKPGMDTREVVARFEAERQALAMMDHPNIAKVFDAGSTDSGRPYFVMEFVKGIPITDYCDKHRLDTNKRLELFRTVCAAVQHAHQKGVIHRDLKPSNILVSDQDSGPSVKVIDFGIAKAISQELTEKTLFTQFGQMVGTPVYMSPEQAEMSGLDIDTRSDVYSLGVVLYELLTGTTPLDPKSVRSAGLDGIQKLIEDHEPVRPSTRIGNFGKEETLSITKTHNEAKERLHRLYRGDLDWIVLRALERDRNRRYETANAFAADISRFLSDEPVSATPPSTGYRISKFVRRNRTGVTVAAIVLVALLAGVAIASWQAIRARKAETLANERLETAERERAAARTARNDAEDLVAYLLGDLQEQLAPIGRLQIMEGVGDTVQDYYQKSPPDERDAMIRQAEAMYLLSEVAADLEEWEKAMALNQRALEVVEPLLADEPADSELAILGARILEQQSRLLLQGSDKRTEALWLEMDGLLERAERILEQAEPSDSDEGLREWLVQSALIAHRRYEPLYYLENESTNVVARLCEFTHRLEAEFEPDGLSSSLYFSAVAKAVHYSEPGKLPASFKNNTGGGLVGAGDVLQKIRSRIQDDPNAKYVMAKELSWWSWARGFDPLNSPSKIAYDLANELVEIDPDNVKWLLLLRDSAGSLQWKLSDQNAQYDAAVRFGRTHLDLSEILAKRFPDDIRYQKRLINANGSFAFSSHKQDPTTAIPCYDRAIELTEQLLDKYPEDQGLHESLAFDLLRVPRPGEDQKKFQEFERSLEHIAIAADLAEQGIGEPPSTATLFYPYNEFASHCLNIGDGERALELGLKALQILEDANSDARADPNWTDDGTNAYMRMEARAHNKIGHAYKLLGRHSEALTHYRESADRFRQLAKNPRILRSYIAHSRYVSEMCQPLQKMLDCSGDAAPLVFISEALSETGTTLAKCKADDQAIHNAVTAFLTTTLRLYERTLELGLVTSRDWNDWTPRDWCAVYFRSACEFFSNKIRPGSTLSVHLRMECVARIVRTSGLREATNWSEFVEFLDQSENFAKSQESTDLKRALFAVDILRLCRDHHQRSGDNEDGKACLREASRILGQILNNAENYDDQERQGLGGVAWRLGEIHRNGGIETELALEQLSRTVEVVGANFGEESVEFADALFYLGRNTRSLGRMAKEAIPILKQAEEIYRMHSPTKDEWVSKSLFELGMALYDIGEIERSLDPLRRVAAYREGEPSSALAGALNILGRSMRRMGEFEEAERLLRRSVAMRSGLHGLAHPDTCSSRRELAKCLFAMGRKADGEALFAENIKLLKAKGSATDGGYLSDQKTAGEWRLQLKRYKEAEQVLDESRRIREQINRLDWNYYSILGTLGQAVAAQNRDDEALDLLMKAWEGLKSHPSPNKSDRINIALRIRDIYRKRGEQENADGWSAILDQLTK